MDTGRRHYDDVLTESVFRRVLSWHGLECDDVLRTSSKQCLSNSILVASLGHASKR